MASSPKNLPQVGKKKLFDPKMILRILWSMLRRRWLALGISVILSAVVGVICSKPMTEKVWRATTMMLYTPPSVPDTVGSLKSTFRLANVSGFATSPIVMEDVLSELDLPFPPDLLAALLKVETSRNTETIFFGLEWKDPDEARKILEQLIVSYPKFVAKVRQSIARNLLQDLERQRKSVVDRLSSKRTEQQEFMRTNNVIDVKQDLVLLQTKVMGLETSHSQVRRDEESMIDQIKMLDDHLDSIRKEEEAEAAAAKDFEAAEETLADNRRRQNRLRELIQEERRVLEINAQIEVKRREYDRVKNLVENQLTPVSRLEKVRGELEALIARITESKTIARWEKELSDLDKLVVPANPKKKKGSPIIHQILFKKLETELKIAHGKKGILEIERELEETRRQIGAFQRLRGTLDAFESQIVSIEDERKAIDDKLATLRQLAEMGPAEFEVINAVSAGSSPIKSNRKKMIVGLAGAFMCLAGATIAAYDVLLFGLIPHDVQVSMQGLPILANIEDDEHRVEDGADQSKACFSFSVRSLALQFRQCVTTSGAVVMVSKLNKTASLSGFVADLAACLASRDERVLVLDFRSEEGDNVGTRLSESASTALFDSKEGTVSSVCRWLTFSANYLAETIQSSGIAAVDHSEFGDFSTGELFATHRMQQLFDEVRNRYTVTIVLTPNVSERVDLEILSSHADWMLFAFDTKGRIDSMCGETITSLVEIDAPIAGAVCV